jgi:hypothetical protein
MVLLLALVSFSLAVALGAWRRSHHLYVPAPRAPGDRMASFVSWIAVAVLSVFPAFVVVALLSVWVGRTLAEFSFGAVVALRWIASNMVWFARGGKPKRLM